MNDTICQNCQSVCRSNQFNCLVCQREMGYLECPKCHQDTKVTSVVNVCGSKCQQILDGEAFLIPIQYEHQNVMMIEDFDEYMGLKVVNHPLLNKILTDEQKQKYQKKCQECKKNQYGLLPYRCWSCKETYSYEIECPDCYNPNGYLCDDCDHQIND